MNVRVDGKAQAVSSRRAAVQQLRAKALKGDPHALDRLLAFAERYDLEDSDDETEQKLSVADQQVLKRFTASVIREHEAGKAESENEDSEEPCE